MSPIKAAREYERDQRDLDCGPPDLIVDRW
jgi:hypothetical protein